MGDDGKRFVGPCRHPWIHVFNHFAVCTVKGCDGRVACRKCGSKDTYVFDSPNVPAGALACRKCGAVWWAP